MTEWFEWAPKPRAKVALLVLLLGACRPDREDRVPGPPPPVQEPAAKPPEVHVSARTGRAIALVIDASGQICAELLGWPERDVHVVCDAGPSDPDGRALRGGLARLRQLVGKPLSAEPVVLLAAAERGADVRALMSADPRFFSRAAIWTNGDRAVIDLFGPSFIGHVASRGGRQLLLLGASDAEYAPWLRLALRHGMELEVVRPEGVGDAPEVLRRLLPTASPGSGPLAR